MTIGIRRQVLKLLITLLKCAMAGGGDYLDDGVLSDYCFDTLVSE